MKYTRSLICEDLIRNANLIILYGVSLGETDNRWWKLIGEQLKTRKNLSIIQYIYMKKALSATRKHLTGQIERKQTELLMQRMGFSKNNMPVNVANQLFFVLNSNAFK